VSNTTLSEHQIRPADTTAETQRRIEADIARLLTKRDEFVVVPCPACGGSTASERFTKYTLSYKDCASCGTVYISPRPPPALLEDYYANSETYAYWNEVIFPRSEDARRERIFRPRVDRLLDLCRAHGVDTNVLVEVGSGFGTFCEELRTRGVFKRVVAIEPTPELAETCKKRGLDVVNTRVEDARLDVRPDVIVSFEVIEHLFEPASFVRTCVELLRPGGLLVLTCPSIRGFDIEVLGAASPSVDAEHLNYFHPKSLSALLASTGLEVLEAQTPGKLDADVVRNRALAGEFQIPDPFLKRVLIDEWDRLGAPFQSFLAANGLSSHMWIVARAPKR
jgi:2-polyprenyl-3-methyl-5-hydroxy-6-metoxy-1,4-benzoquinol methylase